MNADIKTVLNIFGITKRNHDLLLVSVGKVCGYMLILRLVYPSIGTVQPFDTQKFSQKLLPGLWHYAFIALSIPTR